MFEVMNYSRGWFGNKYHIGKPIMARRLHTMYFNCYVCRVWNTCFSIWTVGCRNSDSQL